MGTPQLFDVHDTANRTPRARIQINTGGNTAAVTLESITLILAEHGWSASAEDDDGHTWNGVGDSAMAAVIALLADRLGCYADVRMRPGW